MTGAGTSTKPASAVAAKSSVEEYLGSEAADLLTYKAKVDKSLLHLPGPDFIDRVWSISDRNPQVLRNMQAIYNHGRLAGTGYVSILPVDQGIEHSAGASFAKNPIYFDSENIVKLAIEGGCNAVATTIGVLGSVSRQAGAWIQCIRSRSKGRPKLCVR